MIINGIKSDDYIYVRILEENNYIPFYISHLKKETVIRFNINHLRQWLWKSCIWKNKDKFLFVPKNNADPFCYAPSKLYEAIIAQEDMDLEIEMDARDILLIDEWLWQKLNSTERPPLTPQNRLSYFLGGDSTKSPLQKNVEHLEHTELVRMDGTFYLGSHIFDDEIYPSRISGPTQLFLPFEAGKNTVDKIKDAFLFSNSGVIYVNIKKGERLDLSDPVINFLFIHQNWMRFLANISVLSEEEKMPIFKREFEGFDTKSQKRYFILHNYIKIKSLQEITNRTVWDEIIIRCPSFQNIFYNDDYRYSHFDDFDLDKDGYIRYVWTRDEPTVEHELEKIADRLSYEETCQHVQAEIDAQERRKEQMHLEINARNYFKSHQKRFYTLKKENPQLTEIEFFVQEEQRKKEMLIRRLIKTLNYRIEKSKIDPNT